MQDRQKKFQAADFKGSTAVVVGTGLSGCSAARLLQAKQAKVLVLEKNPQNIPPDFQAWADSVGIEVLLGEHSAEQFKGAQYVVPSPGIPARSLQPFLESDAEILSELELAYRCLAGRESIIAITGTSGKTTTTKLIAAMLGSKSIFVGGNIGTPLSDYILAKQRAEILILEVSSFQLQNSRLFHPQVAVCLNLSPNHLDYHLDMAEYTAAKMQIFANQTPVDVAILPEEMEPLALRLGIRGRKIYYQPSNRFSLQLFGAHNQGNAEAAWLAAGQFGISQSIAQEVAKNFPPLPHRLEKITEFAGVLYVNDSKGTTVESLRVALQAFKEPILLLAGGKFKGGDLGSLVDLVKAKVKHLALFGGSAEDFKQALGNATTISQDTTLEEAMLRLQKMATPGDVILMSPATASYDQYPNYLARGEDFRRIALKLKSEA